MLWTNIQTPHAIIPVCVCVCVCVCGRGVAILCIAADFWVGWTGWSAVGSGQCRGLLDLFEAKESHHVPQRPFPTTTDSSLRLTQSLNGYQKVWLLGPQGGLLAAGVQITVLQMKNYQFSILVSMHQVTPPPPPKHTIAFSQSSKLDLPPSEPWTWKYQPACTCTHLHKQPSKRNTREGWGGWRARINNLVFTNGHTRAAFPCLS